MDDGNVHFDNVPHHVEDAIMKNDYDVFAWLIGMFEAPREAVTEGWCWVDNTYSFLPNSALPKSNLREGRLEVKL